MGLRNLFNTENIPKYFLAFNKKAEEAAFILLFIENAATFWSKVYPRSFILKLILSLFLFNPISKSWDNEQMSFRKSAVCK